MHRDDVRPYPLADQELACRWRIPRFMRVGWGASLSDPDIMTKIKFIGRVGIDDALTVWSRQIPGGSRIGNCEFIFDLEADTYDWLVVYDDLPRFVDRKRHYHREPLACSQRNTILITSEPSSVRRYPRLYLDQFNYVISSQEPNFIKHKGQVYTQCGLRWYYGLGSRRMRSIDDIIAHPQLKKSRDLSAVVSAKAQRHTLHAQRVQFIESLGRALPELERFGHGIRALDDKAEALDPYRYHIAIENHMSPHHWTEKVSDTFLGCALLFYVGAPDLADYIPKDSFIRLDFQDPHGSAERIRAAIANREWEARFDAIMEARRLMLERYGLFQNLEHIVRTVLPTLPEQNYSNPVGVIESAYDARMRQPVHACIEQIRNSMRFLQQK